MRLIYKRDAMFLRISRNDYIKCYKFKKKIIYLMLRGSLHQTDSDFKSVCLNKWCWGGGAKMAA